MEVFVFLLVCEMTLAGFSTEKEETDHVSDQILRLLVDQQEWWKAETQRWEKEREMWMTERQRWEAEKTEMKNSINELKVKVRSLETASSALVYTSTQPENDDGAVPIATEKTKVKSKHNDAVPIAAGKAKVKAMETASAVPPSPQIDASQQHESDEDVLSIATRSDDTGTWEPVVHQLSQQLTEASARLEALETVTQNQEQAIMEARGSVYVRWGRSVCPNSEAVVYSGVAGGSWFHHTGAATNYLCLPMSPIFSHHSLPGAHANLYGAEYQTYDSHLQSDVVCAVCRTSLTTTLMVPATNICPSGWTLNYSGHIMAGAYIYAAGTEYVCVDSAMEERPGSQEDKNGALMWFTAAQCGSLPCPPYKNNSVITCAVCSM